MQRWLIGVAVVTGLAALAISLGVRARVDGGAVGGANRIPLHREDRVSLPRERSPQPGTANEAPASPLITGEDLDARLRALRGHPVVLNAWASWCPPCREELPLLAAAAARYGRRAAFLGADVEDEPVAARGLLAEMPLGYPSYATSLDQLQPLAQTTGTPFTVFVDRNGEVANVHIGAYRSAYALDSDVEALLDG
jgi:cytochrome c biogenesis protein CcmG, thiol:disulfide interchange protein DsbE